MKVFKDSKEQDMVMGKDSKDSTPYGKTAHQKKQEVISRLRRKEQKCALFFHAIY